MIITGEKFNMDEKFNFYNEYRWRFGEFMLSVLLILLVILMSVCFIRDSLRISYWTSGIPGILILIILNFFCDSIELQKFNLGWIEVQLAGWISNWLHVSHSRALLPDNYELATNSHIVQYSFILPLIYCIGSIFNTNILKLLTRSTD